MGGNIAALVGALAPLPVAIAPLAASHSPGPVFTGAVLRGAVAWDALDGVEDPVAAVADLLGHVSVLRLPAPEHTATAVMVAARHDGFVPPEAARALHEHWPGSELRWSRAGHATLLWFGKPALARAVAAAFDRFESAGG
jgi:pimeloyl-ACP methyl ester carboxylesterase